MALETSAGHVREPVEACWRRARSRR